MGEEKLEVTLEITEDEFADVTGSLISVFGTAVAERFIVGFQHDEEFLKTFGSAYN
jgi:hypothetical protein